MIESHEHFMGLGSSKLTLDLMDVKDWDEIVSMVAAAAKQAKPGDWILGRGWHQEKWSSVPKPNVEGFPFHDALSRVSPGNPVMLTHASGHATFVNAKAMAAANLTRTTANPSGGEILKDSTGRPIGLLRETASGIVSRAYETWRSAKTAAERDSQSIGEVMPSILLRDKYRRPLTEVYFPWRRLQVLALDSGGLGAPAIDSSDDRRCRLANCYSVCLDHRILTEGPCRGQRIKSVVARPNRPPLAPRFPVGVDRRDRRYPERPCPG